MIETRHIALILPLIASLTTVAAQLLYKKSATEKQEGVQGRWIFILFCGNFLFLASIVCNFFAMKFIPLFAVYSFTALNYVFVTIASGIFIKETIKWNNILASAIIASGVLLISIP
jgi:drug/metabolite transporter (DMT)-like permease